MPIYEYRCKFCGHEFEVLQGFNDPAPEICPNCKKSGGITKLVSETAFELKGSGWYVTDYKKSSNSSDKSKNKSDSSQTKTEAKKEEKKSA
ncbi:FmdB family zinc ribbon protein [Hippea alviniae]|uniref:FmdB family zinc ribbon protein n=1 Tax=Hippea alviniae TaxID=1279027 RepID=UPI0003B78D54|nr:zinc ribbon domain-containing protein [Hippea alviniae]